MSEHSEELSESADGSLDTSSASGPDSSSGSDASGPYSGSGSSPSFSPGSSPSSSSSLHGSAPETPVQFHSLILAEDLSISPYVVSSSFRSRKPADAEKHNLELVARGVLPLIEKLGNNLVDVGYSYYFYVITQLNWSEPPLITFHNIASQLASSTAFHYSQHPNRNDRLHRVGTQLLSLENTISGCLQEQASSYLELDSAVEGMKLAASYGVNFNFASSFVETMRKYLPQPE